MSTTCDSKIFPGCSSCSNVDESLYSTTGWYVLEKHANQWQQINEACKPNYQPKSPYPEVKNYPEGMCVRFPCVIKK